MFPIADTTPSPSSNATPPPASSPRNFNLDPTGKWLIAAHQGSNSIALFKVDPDTGKLTFTGTKHEVGGPCCVRFLEL
jgi:6-phosphogluconolactonase